MATTPSGRLLSTSASTYLRGNNKQLSVLSSAMVGPANLIGLCALFAAGPSSRQSSINGGTRRRSSASNKQIGRGRYAGGSGGGGGSGQGKRRRPGDASRDSGRRGGGARGGGQRRSPVNAPLPSLTSPNSPRPSYFTCRHTYEDTLSEEVVREVTSYTLGGREAIDQLAVSSPHPGLVCLQYGQNDVTKLLPKHYNPTYALQSMPDCVIVKAESIKGLATSIMDALLDDSDSRSDAIKPQLWNAPRGSLSIHALVPDMFRGVPNPLMKRRSYKIAEEVAAQLKKICPAARPARVDTDATDVDKEDQKDEKWVLQILLLEPEVAAASLTKCSTYHRADGTSLPCSWTWPNWNLPAGLAKVDIEQVMPSSAYRKLLESFWYMGDRPPAFNAGVPPVVDLGASPGGWTASLRLMGCSTLSIDRSHLEGSLMKDTMIVFVEGDAFRFVPSWIDDENTKLESPPADTWMVSDVIAYPERVSETLENWCGKKWVSRVIHTVKFQGKEIPWDELRNAEEIARKHGYACLTKHFFNNKNEVTLMAIDRKCERGLVSVDKPLLGEPMYPPVLGGARKNKAEKS